ncbi:hypothetical protein HBH71_199800 [Parastagonospora nodorum]|nr:hypothetical protein HBH71_199800 [Parastagonospora nodorum]
MSPLTPSKPNGQYVVKIARLSSSGYVSLPAMFKGGWWMDSHAATLLILQNQFRESVISSLATNYLLAQYNVGHIIPRGSSSVVYLYIVDAIEV